MQRIAPVVIVLAALAAVSCGYRLLPEGSGRFSDPTVRVELSPFKNDTTEIDAGAFLASNLRKELRKRGFAGSFDRTEADFLITGRVRQSRDDMLSQSGRFALENQFTLIVEISVVNMQNGKVLWKETTMRERVSYYSGPDPEYTASNRRAAFEEASRRLVLRMAQTIRLIL